MPLVKRQKYEASLKLKAIEARKRITVLLHGSLELLKRCSGNGGKRRSCSTKSPKKKCAMRTGIVRWPELEDNLSEWVLQNRQDCYIVSRNMIRAYAMKWARSNPDKSKDFKATVGWCNRFMTRKNLVLRQKTKIAQKLPRDLEEKITSFHKFIIWQRQDHQFALPHIGNMDETPMNFDMVGNRTVDTRGVHTVQVRSTGHEKTRFTVVLTCMADSTKLRPMVIFKRKTAPKLKFPPGVFVHYHEKGWMDENGVKLWINNVWSQRPGALTQQRSLLVWDMFRSHLTDNTKDRLARIKTNIAVIPGGLTSVLQPLDVSLNKPFKDNVRAAWNDWMMNGEKSYTKGGAMRAAPLDVLCNFVISAWDKVKVECVIKSFKKCGISNVLDGTEDDELWDSDDDEEPDTPADWDPYDDSVAHDVLAEMFAATDDESDFEDF